MQMATKYRRAGGVVADVKRIGDFGGDSGIPQFAPSWEDFVASDSNQSYANIKIAPVSSSGSSSSSRMSSNSKPMTNASTTKPLNASSNPYSLPKTVSAPKQAPMTSGGAKKPAVSNRTTSGGNSAGGRYSGLSAGVEEFKSDRSYGYSIAGDAMSSYNDVESMYYDSSDMGSNDDFPVTAGSGLFAHCIECSHSQQMTEIRSWTCSKCKSFNLIE
jgi:hypothetical protein